MAESTKRKAETALLKPLESANRSLFVAVYGRTQPAELEFNGTTPLPQNHQLPNPLLKKPIRPILILLIILALRIFGEHLI